MLRPLRTLVAVGRQRLAGVADRVDGEGRLARSRRVPAQVDDLCTCVVWLIGRLMDWLIDWSIDGLNEWSID
jgi:hypothetical protein